ncbi:hypothetical protein AX15_002471 [Amanita polypyramis BW_CC]|nr:hypothetical protein AX15_002471 [Amanita polypyramis BW_CC]
MSQSHSSGTSTSSHSPRPVHPRAVVSGGQQNEEGNDSSSEKEAGDEPGDLPATSINLSASYLGRPTSSVSSHRYRTPIAGSHITSPPPTQGIPEIQPRPSFETPSAFAAPESSRSPGGSVLFRDSYVGQYAGPLHSGLATPSNVYPTPAQYRSHSQSVPNHFAPGRPASRITLERAVEHLQAQVAALHERIETLEASRFLSKSLTLSSPRGGSPNDGRGQLQWDFNDLGLWSLVLNPISNSVEAIRSFSHFLVRDESRTPFAIIVRRLCLDFSFLLCAVLITKHLWRESGVRRKEVRVALKMLWRALLGPKPRKVLVDKGV